MATMLQFKCDGCSKEATVKVGNKPHGWGCVSIKISGLSRPYAISMLDADRAFDLCAACQDQLADSAFPPSWPRARCEPADLMPEGQADG